jgi:hypothetical protein
LPCWSMPNARLSFSVCSAVRFCVATRAVRNVVEAIAEGRRAVPYPPLRAFLSGWLALLPAIIVAGPAIVNFNLGCERIHGI